MATQHDITVSARYRNSMYLRSERELRGLALAQPGAVIPLNSEGELQEKPWTPSEESVKFAEQLIRGIIDDLEYARVAPRERLTVCKEPTAIARLENSWTRPSECLTTKPLPSMKAKP